LTNSRAGKGDTAPLVLDHFNKSALTTRVLSALVLAPPVLAAIYFGSPYFDFLVIAAAALMLWEWKRMGGFVLERAHLAAAGILYVVIPCAALLFLRGGAESGRETVFWLFALAWATDIGSYGFGLAIGGPKLAPAISPQKTWAGFFGGVFCAGLIGFAAALILSKSSVAPLILASLLLGVAAQAGDLFESWIKRRFKVKDASNIIPGHGGIHDRVDGLFAIAVAAAAIDLIFIDGFLLWL